MFKKLAVAITCLSCLYVFAEQSPFGISIEKTNIKDLQQIAEKSLKKSENVPGYTETYLNTGKFSLNDNRPNFAKIFTNHDGIVEALVLEYNTNNAKELIEDLDKKYQKTYYREAFYGSYDVEYKNGNCLIRIIKPFCGNTLLLYGTIRWFKSYDDYYRHGNEIRRVRREYAAENNLSGNNQYEKAFNARCSSIRKRFFNDFWNFDDFFENAPSFEQDKHAKSYRSEKRYSKIGDVEEWFYDDNGAITKVKKTPEGTTVTHGDETKKSKEENNEQLLYGRQIKDVSL